MQVGQGVSLVCILSFYWYRLSSLSPSKDQWYSISLKWNSKRRPKRHSQNQNFKLLLVPCPIDIASMLFQDSLYTSAACIHSKRDDLAMAIPVASRLGLIVLSITSGTARPHISSLADGMRN